MARVAGCITALWGIRRYVHPAVAAWVREKRGREKRVLALLIQHADAMPDSLRPGKSVRTKRGPLVAETSCSRDEGVKTTIMLRRRRPREA